MNVETLRYRTGYGYGRFCSHRIIQFYSRDTRRGDSGRPTPRRCLLSRARTDPRAQTHDSYPLCMSEHTITRCIRAYTGSGAPRKRACPERARRPPWRPHLRSPCRPPAGRFIPRRRFFLVAHFRPAPRSGIVRRRLTASATREQLTRRATVDGLSLRVLGRTDGAVSGGRIHRRRTRTGAGAGVGLGRSGSGLGASWS